MPRELNPELFGPRKVHPARVSAPPAAANLPLAPSAAPANLPPASSATPAENAPSMAPIAHSGHLTPGQVAQAILSGMPNIAQPKASMLQAPTSPAVAEFEMGEQYRRKIRDLENQVAVLTQRIEKMTSVFEQRLTATAQAQKAFEQQTKEQFGEVYSQQAAMTSKLTERRVADVKIQEMIDRHNQLVLNFETRMHQIQKVASEQEMKIMTYQATIDEILREIRNLRR